jgi:hypothetical protein
MDREENVRQKFQTGLTLGKYNKIKNGMSFRKAVNMLGSEGIKRSSKRKEAPQNISRHFLFFSENRLLSLRFRQFL